MLHKILTELRNTEAFGEIFINKLDVYIYELFYNIKKIKIKLKILL